MIEQIPDNQLHVGSTTNWLQQLDRRLNEKHLLKHPFYQAWSAGKLSLDDLRYYACQYYHHVAAFPEYIRETIQNCDDPQGREILCDNLSDEQGMGEGQDDHVLLWLKFAKGLGLCEETVKNSVPNTETKQCVEDFFYCSRSSYAEGMGALYAYERQIPQTAASKIMGLKQFYNIEDEETLKFFRVHLEADVKHAEQNRNLIQGFYLSERPKVEAGAKKAKWSTWRLLTGIHDRTIGVN